MEFVNEQGKAVNVDGPIETENVGSTSTEVRENENGDLEVVVSVVDVPDELRNPENQDQGDVGAKVSLNAKAEDTNQKTKTEKVNTVQTIEEILGKSAIETVPPDSSKSNPYLARRLDNVNWSDFSYYEYAFEPSYSNLLDKDLKRKVAGKGAKLHTPKPPATTKKATKKSEPTFVSMDDFKRYFKDDTLSRGTEDASISKYFQTAEAMEINYPEFIDCHDQAIAKIDGYDPLYELYKWLDNEQKINFLNDIRVPRATSTAQYSTASFVYDIVDIGTPRTFSKYASMSVFLMFYYAYKSASNMFGSVFAYLTNAEFCATAIKARVIGSLQESWTVTIQDIHNTWYPVVKERMNSFKESEKTPAASNPPEVKKEQYPLPNSYDFTFFSPHSCNIGFRYIYRQEVRPVGIQAGEMVKTIPLGPKQVQKVSMKSSLKRKSTTSTETGTDFESSSDTNTVDRTTSDTADEETTTHDFNAEISGGYEGGGFKAEAKVGYAYKNNNVHKTNKQQFNESTVKTASKFRNQTKVTVNTETESGFETESSSEIQNPNDEIAVTYVYSKIHQIYEIYTGIAEIETVVFVAEPIPKPSEITANWLRKHSEALTPYISEAGVRRDMMAIVSNPEVFELKADHFDKINTAMDRVNENLSELAKNTGALANLDIVTEAQKNYSEANRALIENAKLINLRKQQLRRVQDYILKDIIFYCQKIWEAEEPSQRQMRYRKQKISFPTNWQMRPSDVAQEIGIEKVIDDDVTIEVHMQVSSKTETAYISDIIDPNLHLGFLGNYSIYKFRRPTWFSVLPETAIPMLGFLKGKFNDRERPGQIMDPEKALIRKELKNLRIEEVHDSNGIPLDISEDLALEIVDTLPKLRLETLGMTLAELKRYVEKNEESIRLQYPEYLYRKRNSRRVVVDTNNLMVDLLKGEGTILEDFKRTHRWIDMKKADQERIQLILENERRLQLLADENLGDPKVDKIVAIGSAEDFGISFNTTE